MFSQRLIERKDTWWSKPVLSSPRSCLDYLHRYRELLTLRSCHDPEDRWRCCSLWHRSLSNKLNSREFAQRHGCRVPDLLWCGSRIDRLPLDELPRRFVIKPAFGHSHERVFVMVNGTNLLDGAEYTDAQLRRELRRVFGAFDPMRVFVEAFVEKDASTDILPIEYKFHAFGSRVAAIQALRREATKPLKGRAYTTDWEPVPDQFNIQVAPDELIGRPDCLDEMLEYASRLGVAFGTYVRIDLYESAAGAVFGEFSSVPGNGRGFTPYVDAYFEACWQQTYRVQRT